MISKSDCPYACPQSSGQRNGPRPGHGTGTGQGHGHSTSTTALPKKILYMHQCWCGQAAKRYPHKIHCKNNNNKEPKRLFIFILFFRLAILLCTLCFLWFKTSRKPSPAHSEKTVIKTCQIWNLPPHPPTPPPFPPEAGWET